MTMTRIATKTLPDCIKNALRSVGYHKADIEVQACETTTLHSVPFEGSRAFACVVNMATGQARTVEGAWGGGNMFGAQSAVDVETAPFALPVDGALIKGESGGQGTFARLYVRPEALAPMLPPVPTATDDQACACAIVATLKGGAYRQDAFRREHIGVDIIESCVAAGWLTRNKAGAIGISTAGKNVAAASKRRNF